MIAPLYLHPHPHEHYVLSWKLCCLHASRGPSAPCEWHFLKFAASGLPSLSPLLGWGANSLHTVGPQWGKLAESAVLCLTGVGTGAPGSMGPPGEVPRKQSLKTSRGPPEEEEGISVNGQRGQHMPSPRGQVHKFPRPRGSWGAPKGAKPACRAW